MYPLVGLRIEEKQEKSCILTVKTFDSISKAIFISKLGKYNLNKITVYWVYVPMDHSQNEKR